MTHLKKRERAKTNASLISMVQRFSDITIMFGGLWVICELSGLPFLYMHLLVALITLVVFQMLGGITDFYRSWRGVKISTELVLLLQNWTLSLIFSAGLIAFNNDFDNRLAVWLAWYLLSSVGLVLSRSFIRYGAGWLRNRGYNTRRVAVAGELPAGQMLLDSFRHEPWLGFEVAGVYHDPIPGKNSRDWAGNLQQLVDDAKASRIHNVYIAMSMSDGASVKNSFNTIKLTSAKKVSASQCGLKIARENRMMIIHQVRIRNVSSRQSFSGRRHTSNPFTTVATSSSAKMTASDFSSNIISPPLRVMHFYSD